jgi:hypothetical protein
MPRTEGTVDCLHFADLGGFVSIRTGPNSVETFILWFSDLRSPGPIALWIPELSIALARGLSVSIFHEADSALIEGVKIKAP